MINLDPHNNFSALDEIVKSKIFRNYIKSRLYILNMNCLLTEDDVINHVVVELLKAHRSGKFIDYPIAWSKIVSERYIGSERRKSKRVEATESERIEYLANHKHTENLGYDEEDEIHKKIQNLKPSSQQILIWRFFQHFCWSQIAELLSNTEGKTISSATARKRGERALDELRKQYCIDE
jgi:DNA-directed RNA polymerase specialized sigma24 family protein